MTDSDFVNRVVLAFHGLSAKFVLSVCPEASGEAVKFSNNTVTVIVAADRHWPDRLEYFLIQCNDPQGGHMEIAPLHALAIRCPAAVYELHAEFTKRRWRSYREKLETALSWWADTLIHHFADVLQGDCNALIHDDHYPAIAPQLDWAFMDSRKSPFRPWANPRIYAKYMLGNPTWLCDAVAVLRRRGVGRKS